VYKLVSLLALMATASTFCGASIAAETLFASALFPASTIDPLGADDAVVLVGGMGGGGTAAGGMTGGGTGAGGTGAGGMTGGGMTGGGMGGGGMTGGGMTDGMGGGGITGAPAANFGGGDGAQPESAAPSAYYTYQCVTPTTQCSFAAPASLRSTSLSAGARCSCSGGRSDGHIK
jgi:hypothetical protein